MTSQQ